ncbi:Endonuclease-reverse transcriptase [Popillia japonica]|uniref:Endonuclease-reverse transcriptase n=1 Tax=Popillia japonica TaxID=7064 RepID=A0AAW1LCX7_POPJA
MFRASTFWRQWDLVKKEISHTPIYVSGLHFLETVGICINIRGFGGLRIFSVYAPPGRDCDWGNLARLFLGDDPALAAGDFNSKHGSWGCRSTNGYGKRLFDYLARIPVAVHPPRIVGLQEHEWHSEDQSPKVGGAAKPDSPADNGGSYGALTLSSTAKTNLRKLEVLQSRILRLITGAPWVFWRAINEKFILTFIDTASRTSSSRSSVNKPMSESALPQEEEEDIQLSHTHWKRPLCFMFCQSATTSMELCDLIKKIIAVVMSTGLIMVATVCDQASQNVAGINALLQEIKQSYFRKNEEFKKFGFEVDEIVALYDYPHLVKCITNNFLTKDSKIADQSES